jgi:chitodextrinase
VTAAQVPLSWAAPTDDIGVTGYRVYRNGLLLGPAATTSYTDLTVSASTSYTYTVTALDGAGNESVQSSPLPVTTAPATGQLLFSDGFETGNLSKWLSVSGVGVQQGLVFSGLWGARMTTTTGATYAYAALSTPATEVTYSLQFLIASQGANNVNLLRLRTGSGGGSLGAVYVTSADRLALRNDSANVSTTSTTVVSQGVWHTLRVHFLVGGVTASLEEVWLDGVKVDLLTRTDTLGTTPIGTVQLGEGSTARTYDIAYDDVQVTTP